MAVAGSGILQAAILGNFFLILAGCVIHEVNFQRSMALCNIRPYIHKCPCGTSGEECVIMLFGCNFRADCTAIRVGLVDFQTAQRSILGYGTNRYGVGSGIIALGHNHRCSGRAINQGDCYRLGNTAFAGSGRERDTLGPYGHHQLIVVAARCEFLCKCTYRSGDAGQVGIVGGQGKEAAAVIAVVNRAVRAADGADQAVLGVGTGIENLL